MESFLIDNIKNLIIALPLIIVLSYLIYTNDTVYKLVGTFIETIEDIILRNFK